MATGRVDISDGHQGRPLGQRLDRTVVLDGGHGNRILRLHASDAARRPDDVGALDVRLIGEEVADGHRHVDRLDHDATLPVQHDECVGELQDIAEGLDVAVASAAFEIANVRRPVDGTEVDYVAADVQISCGVAGVQHEAFGRVP